MDTSRSIDSSPSPEIQERDRLFYDRYEWSIDFRCNNAGCLRLRGHTWQEYQADVQQSWSWRNTSIIHAYRRVVPTGGSWKVDIDPIESSSQSRRLEELARVLWKYRDLAKTVCYGNWIYVYAHDLAILQDLSGLVPNQNIKLKQARITRERDTLHRKNPQHSYRSFLRSRRLTVEQKTSLKKFLLAQEQARLGPAFRSWLDQQFEWTRDYHWLDHDDQGIKTMLEIIVPGLIGRTQRLITINST